MYAAHNFDIRKRIPSYGQLSEHKSICEKFQKLTKDIRARL